MAVAEPVRNSCAGPFGAFYDFYIERPRLVSVIGRAVWGIDASVLYESMAPISRAADGATIADVPYSGLHMVPDPERAIAEIARCLKPGGQLIGTSFFSDASWRARAIFGAGSRRGHPLPPSREALRGWLDAASFERPTIGPQAGFAVFEGRKPTS
jgi:SAM-dependent methyltransferase